MMRKIFSFLGRIIGAPFRFIYRKIEPYPPIRWIKKFHTFINTEPEEHSLLDSTAAVIQSKESRDSFFDHIEKLRKHLGRILLVLMIGTGVAFFYSKEIINILAQEIGGTGTLTEITPTESVSVYMRVAIMSGIILVSPYIAGEFWWFFAPGIKSKSKKFGLAGIPIATLLFVGGVWFSYSILLPPALRFLMDFLETQKNWSVSYYINFATNIIFWIGLFFEFPLVIYALSAIKLIKPKVLLSQWRLAIVIIAILAAAITPTIDPGTMTIVMLPMILIYFLGVGASFIAYREPEEDPTEN